MPYNGGGVCTRLQGSVRPLGKNYHSLNIASFLGSSGGESTPMQELGDQVILRYEALYVEYYQLHYSQCFAVASGSAAPALQQVGRGLKEATPTKIAHRWASKGGAKTFC